MASGVPTTSSQCKGGGWEGGGRIGVGSRRQDGGWGGKKELRLKMEGRGAPFYLFKYVVTQYVPNTVSKMKLGKKY